MAVRVELIPDAIEDLRRYAKSGSINHFLAKLVRIEDAGADAGLPLGGALKNWRKIVVGDRDWRIIFTIDIAGELATVCAIGDRSDQECYDLAAGRLEDVGTAAAVSLAAAMLTLRKEPKRTKARRAR